MTYPKGHFVTRVVLVGDKDKQQLQSQLAEAGVELNEAARTLFSSAQFTTSIGCQRLNIVELAVGDLGFTDGATASELYETAKGLGLSLAPMELGPHFRLQYPDQPEGSRGHPLTEHRAPPGSITVASPRLSEDDEFPKGFYLRRIDGKLWLRGYRCSSAHVWAPEDRFVFCK